MRLRFAHLLALFAWLLATGSHWDLVQGLGWGRMIATYSQTMPLAEAIRLTFTPDNMCGVCEAVAAAKQVDSDPAAPSADPVGAQKIFLSLAPAEVLVFAALPAPRWPAEHFQPDACARPAPPVEPPRAA
ncbi:MAG: hypothetical protein RIQ79_1634 [Verrucomicrobiota bacterium]|jgi:hypothetical protein